MDHTIARYSKAYYCAIALNHYRFTVSPVLIKTVRRLIRSLHYMRKCVARIAHKPLKYKEMEQKFKRLVTYCNITIIAFDYAYTAITKGAHM